MPSGSEEELGGWTTILPSGLLLKVLAAAAISSTAVSPSSINRPEGSQEDFMSNYFLIFFIGALSSEIGKPPCAK